MFQNKVGVFQGSPISAQLFIIYADNIMLEYTDALNKSNIPQQTYKIRNKLGDKWATDQLSNNNINNSLYTNNENFEPSIQSQTCGRTLFADDTCLDIPNIDCVYPKLKIYNNIDGRNAFIIQWGKVFIPIKQKDIYKTEQLLKTLPGPYINIQRTNKSNILGHIMTVDHSTAKAAMVD